MFWPARSMGQFFQFNINAHSLCSGTARIIPEWALFWTLGLRDRMIGQSDGSTLDKLKSPIKWEQVQIYHNQEKQQSIAFLNSNLNKGVNWYASTGTMHGVCRLRIHLPTKLYYHAARFERFFVPQCWYCGLYKVWRLWEGLSDAFSCLKMVASE